MTFILIHALLKEQMQIKFKKRHQDDLAVPGFKVNVPRHIGGKDSVFSPTFCPCTHKCPDRGKSPVAFDEYEKFKTAIRYSHAQRR